VPKNVPALISDARIDANTAHHGIDRPPNAKSATLALRRLKYTPMQTITAKYAPMMAKSNP
jgi:hypothetical protein